VSPPEQPAATARGATAPPAPPPFAPPGQLGYDVGGKAVKRLEPRLIVLDAATTLAESVDALVGLGRWLGEGGDSFDAVERDGGVSESGRTRRLRLLIGALAASPGRRQAFARAVTQVLDHSSGLELFAHTGLPSERGFLGEIVDRLTAFLLPSPRDDAHLGAVLSRLLPSGRDAAWLASVPPPVLLQLIEMAGLGPAAFRKVRRAALEAVTLLGTRVSAIGLSREILSRARPEELGRSPFLRLSRVCDGFADSVAAAPAELDARAAACRVHVEECRAVVELVKSSLEATGVSVEVVYQLNVMEKALRRIDELLEVAAPADGGAGAAAVRLVGALLAAQQRERRVREILRDNLQLLARKVVERAGVTGEHYITADRKSWFAMLRSAAGGGLLTAGTILVKFLLALVSLPLFLQGVTASLNYSLSFIVMQLFHFTLATKQPAMTAAALAHGIELDSRAGGGFAAITELIARITRSQLAAALGNLGAVIPAAIGLDLAWQFGFGHHILSEATAHYVIGSLDPFGTLTVVYAAYTGVLLWIASVCAGWVDNWSVYHRLPEAMEQHKQRKVAGERAMGVVGRFLTRNLSGLTGNIALGTFLGMSAAFGKFFGVPIDVRHVTLSTGSLAIAAAAIGPEVFYSAAFYKACLGIVLIGLLNFGVSFALALSVAFRARGIGVRERFGLGRALVHRWRQGRRDFFLPPKKDAPATAQIHPH
jgi:site-specific recombinase